MKRSIHTQTIAGLATLTAILAAICAFASFATIAGTLLATGVVETVLQNQIVQHPEGGMVSAIRIKEGDDVRAGEVLVSLEDGQLRTEMTITENRYIEIQARVARLRAEERGSASLSFPGSLVTRARREPAVADALSGQNAVFEAGRRTYLETVAGSHELKAQLLSEIDGLKAEISALDAQTQLVNDDLERARILQRKGLVAASRVSDIRRTLASQAGERAQAEARISALHAECARLDVELLRIAAANREKAANALRESEAQLQEIREQRLALGERVSRLDLRAPRDGKVQALAVHTIGAVLRPAEPALMVVPQGGNMTIRANVDAANIDSVALGLPATVRFASMDSWATPELAATITRISAASLVDDRTGARYFEAEATLNPGEIRKLGDTAMVAGMPVEVIIRTKDRSPLGYLVKPLVDYAKHALGS